MLTRDNAKKSVIFRWLRHERSGKCFLTHCWGPDEIRVLQGGAGYMSIFLLLLTVACQYFFARDLFKFIEAI
jgi:hypothetical protein